MRIAYSNFYTKFLTDQQRALQGLNSVYSQTSSGMKIQYGYEDTNKFVSTLSLNQKEVNLLQVKDVSNKAKEFSKQTDQTLGDFTSSLDTFKQKLLASANDIHSESSRIALVKELESLKDHMINLSNTSLAGHYIFSGSLVDKKPFNDDGTYNGNDEDIKALIGSNNQIKYNMSGQDVFLSKDTDYYKSVTTNVSLYNQTKLHNDVMSVDNKDGISEEAYITPEDSLRDLVGDTDDNKTNNGNVYFYLRGKKSNGESLQEKFSLSQGDTVQTILDRIEKAYDKGVTATINDYGQIEVKDKINGSSQLDFHLVGAVDLSGGTGADVTDLNDLTSNQNVDIIEFMKSKFEPTKTVTTANALQDKYDHKVFTINSDFVHNGTQATDNTKIQDILGSDVDFLAISGKDTSGAVVPSYQLSITSTTTFKDLQNDIKSKFGNVSVYMNNGKLTIEDDSIEKDGTSKFSLNMKAQDSLSNDLVKFSPNEAIVMDKEYFTKSASKLTSNVSQIDKNTNNYATISTKLVDVAGISTLDKTSLSLTVKDINGNDKNVTINLRNVLSNPTTAQSQNITAGAGGTTITLDSNFKDLKVGATMLTSSGDYLKVTSIDKDNKQITLSGSTGAGATSIKWLEGYEDTTLSANVAIGDDEAFLTTNFNNLNIGDTLDLDGEDVTITGIDKSTNKVTFTPQATASHASGNTTRYQNVQKSYFSVDGVDYPIYDENFEELESAQMYGLNDTELASAIGAGYSKYNQDSVYVTSNELTSAKVGDYIRIGNEYKEITKIDDDTSVAGRKLINFQPDLDYVPQKGDDITLVRAKQTPADSFTYGQLNDIISMVTSANLPNPENKQPGYYKAVQNAQDDVQVSLTNRGQIQIQDMNNSKSKIEFAMYDDNTSYFGSASDSTSPILTFQSNNALTIDDQHVNFFDRLQDAIDAVSQGIYSADASSTDPRNAGIQNAITSIDHLSDHMSKMQTVAGTQSQKLQYSVERTEILITHVKELRSNVIDIDYAEVALEMQQRTLNYQAMLSTVSKINGLSLVNYLK